MINLNKQKFFIVSLITLASFLYSYNSLAQETTINKTLFAMNSDSSTDIKISYDEFAKRFQTEGKTPEGSIKMLFEALLKIEDNYDLAEALVAVVLNGKDMSENSGSISGYDIGSSARYMFDRIKDNYRIVRSYVGAVPDDDYNKFDKNNLVVNFPPNGKKINGLKVDNTITEKSTKGRIYVQSSGKDFPTPIYLEKNSKGLWKVSYSSISSIATGVRKQEKDF